MGEILKCGPQQLAIKTTNAKCDDKLVLVDKTLNKLHIEIVIRSFSSYSIQSIL